MEGLHDTSREYDDEDLSSYDKSNNYPIGSTKKALEIIKTQK